MWYVKFQIKFSGQFGSSFEYSILVGFSILTINCLAHIECHLMDWFSSYLAALPPIKLILNEFLFQEFTWGTECSWGPTSTNCQCSIWNCTILLELGNGSYDKSSSCGMLLYDVELVLFTRPILSFENEPSFSGIGRGKMYKLIKISNNNYEVPSSQSYLKF